ncbi:MAG: radical SAM protein [Oscillospiraceae bacterium]|nr:radical SAM protein [Oscillospiraceae bacterium]
MNPYRGCTHGCIYCDSRSDCYQMSHDFSDIEVKRGAARILEEQLAKKREPRMIVTGAMCDPYIQLEEELKVTRQCLEVIEKYGFGVAILTKSRRILRDIDILRRINDEARCVAQVTLTTFDDDLCRITEPNASATSERFETLMRFKDAGIPTAVWLCPILPFINDTEENLRGLLDYCKRADVKAIMFFGASVTLRDGNREYFYERLDEHFPKMKERYIRAFGNGYVCESPNNRRLTKIFTDFCLEHGIISDPDDVFAYLRKFESGAQRRQMSLFDL